MVIALLVYDWLLCFEQEVKFIWTWRSRGITLASLVYMFSRYSWLMEGLLSVATIYPMSELVKYLTAAVQLLSDRLVIVYTEVLLDLHTLANNLANIDPSGTAARRIYGLKWLWRLLH